MTSYVPTPRFADDLFNLHTLLRPATNGKASHLPLEAWETEDAYVVKLDVPGVGPEQIEITLHERVLKVKVERTPVELEGATRRLGQLPHGTLERSLRLNSPVAVDKIEAESKYGVLTITVPKAEDARPRKIEIKVVE